MLMEPLLLHCFFLNGTPTSPLSMPSCRPGWFRSPVYKTTSPSCLRLQSRSGRAWLCKTSGNGRAKVKCTQHLDKLQVNVSKSPVMTDGLFQLTGVIALMPFHKGDIVCDYHGTYITEAEGKRRPQSGYLFFFRDECDRGMCIDATAFPCACHPDIDTYGRRMNHSRKNPNIKPQKFTMNFPAGPQETILFIALKDIAVGEEVLWDYGVTRKSYGGEGEDLEWLDS
uniref:SET domain-containing protein n=1 Tax=Haplochromis burtoni TaxID=8153 RepID=A0A3Q2WPW0_HAPBU